MIRWDDTLWLFTEAEYEQLPDGIELTGIGGDVRTKGVDEIDKDTRFGYLAYGVHNPSTHPESELFTKFMLQGTQ